MYMHLTTATKPPVPVPVGFDITFVYRLCQRSKISAFVLLHVMKHTANVFIPIWWVPIRMIVVVVELRITHAHSRLGLTL